MYMVGVDLGTTNWKIGLYTLDGHLVATQNCPGRLRYVGPDQAVYEPQVMWDTVCEGLRDLIEPLGPDASQIASIGVSSVGESGVLIDEHGDPACDSMAWFDQRPLPFMAFWEREYGLDEVYERTGTSPQHFGSINKILWTRENEPEAFRRGRKWLSFPAYIAYKLTGEMAIDFSLASRTMCFDIECKAWSETILDTCGVSSELFPDAVPSRTAMGRVTEDAARACGLPPGTVVAAGGHDQICGAFAAGVLSEGAILSSSGTGEAIVVILDQAHPTGEFLAAGLSIGCHVVDGRYYIMGGTIVAGSAIEWVKEAVGAAPEIDSAEREGASTYDRLIETALGAPPGAGGVLFLPYLRGSEIPGEESVGAGWIGVRRHHGRAHLIRAVIEGLAHQSRRALDLMLAVTGIDATSVAAVGGGTRNDLWLQSKSDVWNMSMDVPEVEDTPVLGGALLGALAAGVYDTPEMAAQAVRRVKKTVHPRAQEGPVLRACYDRYRRLCALLPSFHKE